MSVASAPQAAVEQAAKRLQEAAASGVPCGPVRDLIGPADLEAAYSVQGRVIADRVSAGATVVGRKIGLTSEAVQRQLGVGSPDFGVLLDDMEQAESDVVPVSRLLQPKIEAEIAFVLAGDLDGDGPATLDEVRAAVDYAVPALEIVDSRIAGWDIALGDTVADNASSGLFVLGAKRLSLHAFEPVMAEMWMTLDGVEVSKGDGAACLGDPLAAVAWLATTARALGDPLRAGQVVLSGALGPMVPVTAGSRFHAEISGLGSVSAAFGEGEAE